MRCDAVRCPTDVRTLLLLEPFVGGAHAFLGVGSFRLGHRKDPRLEEPAESVEGGLVCERGERREREGRERQRGQWNRPQQRAHEVLQRESARGQSERDRRHSCTRRGRKRAAAREIALLKAHPLFRFSLSQR